MTTMPYRELSPKQAQQELQRDPSLKLLDVRTPPEYEDYRLKGCVLLPLQELPRRFRELDIDLASGVTVVRGPNEAGKKFIYYCGGK